MTTIGNIGIGLFLILIVWLVTLIVFIVAIKFQSNIAWVALGPATALTLILLVIPVEKRGIKTEEFEVTEKDYIIIYKTLCLALVSLSAIIGFVAFFLFHCIKPVQAKPLQQIYRRGVYFVPE